MVVAITGAARGIGLATARLLAERGERVAIADIDGDLAVTRAATLDGECRGYGLDVSDRTAFDAFADRVEADLGPIDVMINNAGIALAAPDSSQMSGDVIDRTLDVNLRGVIHGTLAAVRLMKPRGQGRIVNVASLAGVMGIPGMAAYAASKFGVVGFTESIRAELADSGIAFSCIMPGPVSTEMMHGTHKSPFVRLVTPEAVAATVVRAIDTDQARVTIPRSTGVLTRVLSLLPPRITIRVNRLIGLDRVYTDIDEAARLEYSERVKRDINQ